MEKSTALTHSDNTFALYGDMAIWPMRVVMRGSDNNTTDSPFSTERTVRSVIITAAKHNLFYTHPNALHASREKQTLLLHSSVVTF